MLREKVEGNVFKQILGLGDAALKGLSPDILSALKNGRLHVTQNALKHSTELALRSSKVRLIALSTLADSIEFRFNVGERVSFVAVREAVIRASVCSVTLSDSCQKVEVKVLSAKLYGDVVVSRIAIWFAQTFFGRVFHSVIEKAMATAISNEYVSAMKKADTGTLVIDIGNVPSIKSIASARPIPLVNKGPLSLLNVTSIEHCSGGIDIVCYPRLA